ncbi:MAG: hypothetical protein U5L96_04405 [Owenweeksia sp.]|nr:hypothetical protein [Owenweeksia sp.]
MMEAALRFHDMMLERLLNLAGPQCDVILLSDHGFQSGKMRVPELPDVAAAPALEHRRYGVFAAVGPSFEKDQKIYGASLLDVAPTVLHYFNLPVGADMEGRVLQNIFKKQQPVSEVPSWEVTGVEPQFVEDPRGISSEALEQLQALGYIDLQKSQQHHYVEQELCYNLCTSLLEGRKLKALIAEALPVWEQSHDLRFGLLLAEAYLQEGNDEVMKMHLTTIEHHYPGNGALLFIKGMHALRHNLQEEALGHFTSLEDMGAASVRLTMRWAGLF